MKKHPHQNPLLLTLLLSIIPLFRSIFAADFVFNGFNSSDILLYGDAALESRVLTLTNDTNFSIGRALYPSKIPTKNPTSSYVYPFSTSFIFSIAPYKKTLAGHGLVLLFVPFTGIYGATSSQNLGLFNRTNDGVLSNHILGIEFDVFKNEEFNDIDANHVGIDVNSLKSLFAHRAGYWPENQEGGVGGGNGSDEKSFKELKLNNGKNYQVWIDYSDSVMNVTMALAGMKRPQRPLLNVSLNLSEVFEDDMYVGFTASTGQLVESHKILSWSFSNTNFLLSEKLVTRDLPNFALPKESIFKSKGLIAGINFGSIVGVCVCALFFLFLIKRRRRKLKEKEEMEEWELEYWPHRITYQEIDAATNGFAEENVIGIGGNGKVYKGVLMGGAEIAVKLISQENDDGTREFLAEIASLGRLKHRNLVGLRGWCKREKGTFMLIYDYMENGSLDKLIFHSNSTKILSLEDRIRILKDVAYGVLYLHDGWESRVLHRDIKSSNVLLDKEMRGRLGDFGLARMHSHGQVASTTTRVVGTAGYLAPEVVRTGKASAATDVYGFGVLILEVMCGRRPIEEGKPALVEWVLEMMVKGELEKAVDKRLRVEEFTEAAQEVERVLQLGLLCAHPDGGGRPSMRQAVQVLEGRSEGREEEKEDIDVYLLEKMRSKDTWCRYSESTMSSHPTFEEFRAGISSSMSVYWSNSMVEGR